ncbi:heterokaryon incompatibility protein-domain-containing protein [Cadophora sp. MPI-SDFR-AT-0126]|nr:heterokaryon incompatibility protein-domain-containing protein [Leotiomycetes sp. MPI-SDFR-AT-0126]
MSLEDLYRDLAISKEEGVLNSTPLPPFNFPDLPEALTTAHDKQNWKTLGEVLSKCNGHVATLDKMVSDLVDASERFRYIGDSVRWMKTELERMCEMPPLILEESETSTESEELSDEEIMPLKDGNSAIPDEDTSDSDASSVESGESDIERLFRPSDMYDWSEIEEDVHMLQEIILMNPLMAIYEIIDSKTVSDLDMDELFAQPFLADWEGDMVETLLEALEFLSQLFLKEYEPELPGSPVTAQGTGEQNKDISGSEPARPYPSPKMTDAHEIRILELLPGLSDEPIQGLLTIEHLWDDPRYEALSYAWGTSTKLTSIWLNETEFGITPNLRTALLHLRDEKEPRRLWIDALCINQSDAIEKQGQVKLMSEIYPAAENVLCWLGPEGSDSDFVFQRLQELANIAKPLSGSVSDDDELSNSGQEFFSNLGLEEEERFFNGLFKLLSRPWWSRLWTCQEFALTVRDPKIICGKQIMPWSRFRHAAKKQALRMPYPTRTPDISDITELDQTVFWTTNEIYYGFVAACNLRTRSGFVGLYSTAFWHPLHAMILFTRRYRCLDPRDKLFGILSFLLEPHRALLPPNYSQSAGAISTRFSAAALAVSGSGRMYSFQSVGSRSGKEIPSWAFDLSSRTVDGESDPTILFMPADEDHFSGASKGRRTQCIPLGPRLIIRGVVLDPIDTISSFNSRSRISAAGIYEDLLMFQALALERSMIDIPSDATCHQFKHLRTAYSASKIISCGMCNDEDLHDLFQPWASVGGAALNAKTAHLSPEGMAKSPVPSWSSSSLRSSSSSTETKLSEAGFHMLLYSLIGRKLLITRWGFFGIGVSEIREGDLVVVLFGFDGPMVLRDRGDHFSMVGAARVGGIMEGELMKFVDDGTLQEKTFLIK